MSRFQAFFLLVGVILLLNLLFTIDYVQFDSSSPIHVPDYSSSPSPSSFERNYVITKHSSDALLFIIRTTSTERLSVIYSTWANSTQWSVGHTFQSTLVRADLPPQYKTVVLVDDSTYIVNHRFKETSTILKNLMHELEAQPTGDPYRFLNLDAFSGLESDDILALHDDFYSNGVKWSKPIPRIIHQFNNHYTSLIDTCRAMHPEWTHKLWAKDVDPFNILVRFGGVFIPADHVCLLPLDLVFVDNEEGLLFGEVLAVRPFSPIAMFMNALKKPISVEMVSDLRRSFAIVQPNSAVIEKTSALPKKVSFAPLSSPSSSTPSILRSYIQTHLTGVSLINQKRPRLVIANVVPSAGMCNRFMNILSSLVFAIVTGRSLVFDWDSVSPRHWYSEMKEAIGHASYSSVFGDPPIGFYLRDLMDRFDSSFVEGRISFDWSSERLLTALASEDLDQAFPESIVFFDRHDWWIEPIKLNPRYREIVKDLSFSTLFKFLFPDTQHTEPLQCNTFMQIRRQWERNTASMEHFMKCAPEKNDLVVVADHPLEPSNYKAITNYCRDGTPECDKQTVKMIYSLVNCKQAVLTHTSTFGACISALAEIPPLRVSWVHQTGECFTRGFNVLVDAGVLDSQRRMVEGMLNDPPAPKLRCAFVYLVVNPNVERVSQLRKSIEQLHRHFNHKHHYSIVVMTNKPRWFNWIQAEVSVRVHIVPVNDEDWAVPSSATDYPEVFRLASVPQHRGFSVAYRQMSRYSAGFMLNHPFFSTFDYILKIDTDTFATQEWQKDPFAEMSNGNKQFGFWIRYSDTPDVTENLEQTFKQFLKENPHLTLKQPELVFDSNGNYKRTNFYGCFVAVAPELFRRPLYQQLFRFLDERSGWFKYRWDEQKIVAFYVALVLEKEQVEFMNYVHVEHQVWATAPRIID